MSADGVADAGAGPGGPVPFGDRAVLVPTADVQAAHRVARAVDGAVDRGRPPPGVVAEVVVGMASVVVVIAAPEDGTAPRLGPWLDWTTELVHTGHGGAPDVGTPTSTVHRVPVVFDGADLADVAERTGLTPDAVVAGLVGTDLRVGFVGFAPGFPYLVGVPAPLDGLPRRPTPRTSVPAGSVALADGFAGIYPRSSPGGWWLVGRTSFPLVDPTTPPYARLRAGDAVRLTPATALGQASESPVDPSVDPSVDPPVLRDPSLPHLVVEDPGVLTLVEDRGRAGVARAGIPPAGAADADARELVLRLLGAPADAAVLECTVRGPAVRIEADTHVAVLGADPGSVGVTLDGRDVGDARVVPVRTGQRLVVGTVRHGLRAYLGVGGGVVAPPAAGSRSADVWTGLGPPPLRAGDVLGVVAAGRPRGHLVIGGGTASPRGGGRPAGLRRPVVLRVLAGPTPVGPGPWRRLVGPLWRVTSDSDRIGLRLEPVGGAPLPSLPPVRSTGMVTGAVQVPPDGRPIVLLPDHATVGGYPVPATVIAADLHLLGQLAPGGAVTFRAVAPDDAVEAWEARSRRLDRAVRGWYPTATG